MADEQKAGAEAERLKTANIDIEKELVVFEDRIEEKQVELRHIEAQAALYAWALLERAFGNDGVIALEIDDAGPAISSSANDLLSSCFGTRFSANERSFVVLGSLHHII